MAYIERCASLLPTSIPTMLMSENIAAKSVAVSFVGTKDIADISSRACCRVCLSGITCISLENLSKFSDFIFASVAFSSLSACLIAISPSATLKAACVSASFNSLKTGPISTPPIMPLGEASGCVNAANLGNFGMTGIFVRSLSAEVAIMGLQLLLSVLFE